MAGKPVPSWWPANLRDLVSAKTGCFKRELVRGIARVPEPRRKAQVAKLIAETEALFAEAKRTLATGPRRELSEGDLQFLADHRRAEILSVDEHLRREGFGLMGEEGAGVQIGSALEEPGLTTADYDFLGAVQAERFADMKRELATRRPPAQIIERAKRAAAELLSVELQDGSEDLRDAALRLLEAEVLAFQDATRRHNGEVVRTPATPSTKPANRADASDGPRLTEAFKAWSGENANPGKEKPASNTIREADHAVRRFIELHGDLFVRQITRKHAREFRDALLKLPTRLPGYLRQLPLPKLLAEPAIEKMPKPNVATVNKAMALLSAILSEAADDHDLEADAAGWSNPFKGLRIKGASKAEGKRRPFEMAELRKVFSDPEIIGGDKPKGGGRGITARWLPLLALFNGARREELAQLKVRDVMLDDVSGRWFLNLTNLEDDQSLKTDGSVRKVPVHRELIACGFLEYVAARRRKELDGWLFPLLTPNSEGIRGDSWGRWFGRKLDELGLSDPRLVFHSFRHTFLDRCRDCDVPREIAYAFTGHATGKTVGDDYGRGFSITRLAREMDKVRYPGLDLSAYYVQAA
ncbi:site-specific integrase [Blastochloris tepida]|nr:site-specific integrase [Blastochloris tepida]